MNTNTNNTNIDNGYAKQIIHNTIFSHLMTNSQSVPEQQSQNPEPTDIANFAASHTHQQKTELADQVQTPPKKTNQKSIQTHGKENEKIGFLPPLGQLPFIN